MLTFRICASNLQKVPLKSEKIFEENQKKLRELAKNANNFYENLSQFDETTAQQLEEAIKESISKMQQEKTQNS